MNEAQAATLADKILLALVTNNPNCIGNSNLTNKASAEGVAQALAVFRQRLITDLVPQPE